MKKGGNNGFSVIELMVSLAILVTLATLAGVGYGVVRAKGDRLACLQRMSTLSKGIILYAQDHGGALPKSSHSGGSPHWVVALVPYIGEPEGLARDDYQTRDAFICPVRARSGDAGTGWSYALNVFFELSSQPRYTAAGRLIRPESYHGSPLMWQRMVNIERPSRTILLAETSEGADHFMAHQWQGSHEARSTLATDRHDRACHIAFVDGHIELLTPEETLDPSIGRNLWNPMLAQ